MLTFCFGFDFFSTTKSKLCQNFEFTFMFEQIPCVSKSKPCIKKSKPQVFKTNQFWFSIHFPQSFVSCSYSKILSVDFFFQKYPNSFGGENWDKFGYFDTLPSSLSLINLLVALKMSIFLTLRSHARQGSYCILFFIPHNQWLFYV